ncbi:hypothetical protein K7R09_20970 [Serratia ureilytica]|uniref:Restriction endonuclease n=1 Tax=Serratia ureilytica TaxID=300181 RepID=A0ABU0VN48_9GAMM|nr:hypothetical protein [Serratia ureilytica]MCU7064280.1 hypothetical protein [Serratia ureilytica]MDQ1806656.1 hypothetical protein [Serratia ureilytica]MDQ1835713.1 hypothetical protein [Serratia ureilytica]MDQ1862864.1 hypothetical protein [Serratia ureilytica]
MVTYTTMVLPPPKSWDEFEDICKSSFQLRWNSHDLTRHGRSGQAQDGVDIYGNDVFGLLVGIQCKNTVKNINISTINDEIIKAERFQPGITALYIATTAPRDVNIQAYVRSINFNRQTENKFLVNIVFWDDITSDLAKDGQILKQHYPVFFGKSEPTTEELLRRRDISNLTSLLQVIDFPSTSDHLNWDAKYIHELIIEEFENIQKVYHSPVFTLNDNVLMNATVALIDTWSELCNSFAMAPYNYLPQSNTYSFITPGDFCRNKEENDLFEKITAQMRALQVRIDNFCNIINNHYHEINLIETSRIANRYY